MHISIYNHFVIPKLFRNLSETKEIEFLNIYRVERNCLRQISSKSVKVYIFLTSEYFLVAIFHGLSSIDFHDQ